MNEEHLNTTVYPAIYKGNLYYLVWAPEKGGVIEDNRLVGAINEGTIERYVEKLGSRKKYVNPCHIHKDSEFLFVFTPRVLDVLNGHRAENINRMSARLESDFIEGRAVIDFASGQRITHLDEL